MESNRQEKALRDYTINRIEAKGRNFYVNAPDYQKARQWFNDNIIDKNINIGEMNVEISGEEEVYVSRITEEEPLNFICHKERKDESMESIYNKGYFYNSDSYIFSVIDLKVQTTTVRADSEEKAFNMATHIFETQDIIPDEQRQVYSADKDRIVTIGNDYCFETFEIRKEEDLAEELKKQFPDGMTVLLENESVARLKEFAPYMKDDNEPENIPLMGMVEAGEGTSMAGAYGLLKAELRLKPEDYDLLYACDRTYYSEELSDIGFDTGVNSTTVMLNTEDSLRDSRIQTEVCPALLDNLYIEGEPYKNVMDIINQHKVTDDAQLKNYFNWEILRNMPQWKFDMAKQAVKEQMHKDWVEQLGPVYREQNRMGDETMDQAAKEFGYKDRHEYKRDYEWGRNPSPQLIEKLKKVHERHMELYEPYNKKAEEAGKAFEQKENRLMVAFIHRFNKQAQKVVSDARIIQRLGDEMAIRCKIGDEQQMGKKISAQEATAVNQYKGTNIASYIKDLAQKYFCNEIAESMQQQQNRALKR